MVLPTYRMVHKSFKLNFKINKKKDFYQFNTRTKSNIKAAKEVIKLKRVYPFKTYLLRKIITYHI